MKRKLENHHNLEVKDSNGIVLCQCHDDTGVVEIKCPYCHCNDAIDSAAIKDSKFCLLMAHRAHAYYYQVQTQLFLFNANFCDFLYVRLGQE